MDTLIQTDFSSHWREDETAEQYHLNRSAVNSSSLKKILKSPNSFRAEFTRQFERKETPAMKFGTLVHTAILEGKDFKERYAVMPDFGDQRTKINKQAKTEWLAENEGKLHCTQRELDATLYMIESVLAHRDADKLLKHGKTEVSGYFRDPDTGIIQKIRPDFISFNLNAEVDIKTTVDCSREAFTRSIWNYRYDFQRVMYREGIKHITGKEVNFSAFIAIEKEPPYECAVYIADEGFMDRAYQDYRKALELLHDSIIKNEWHPYQQRLENISLPTWAF